MKRFSYGAMGLIGLGGLVRVAEEYFGEPVTVAWATFCTVCLMGAAIGLLVQVMIAMG